MKTDVDVAVSRADRKLLLFAGPASIDEIMQAMKFQSLIVALIFAFLLSPAHAAEPGTSQLVGHWKLVSIDGEAPPGFLDDKVLVLDANGTIASIDSDDIESKQSSVTELVDKAVQKGTWRVADGKLFASNSTRKDGAAFSVTDTRLTFERDPYLSAGDVPSKSVYKRLSR